MVKKKIGKDEKMKIKCYVIRKGLSKRKNIQEIEWDLLANGIKDNDVIGFISRNPQLFKDLHWSRR